MLAFIFPQVLSIKKKKKKRKKYVTHKLIETHLKFSSTIDTTIFYEEEVKLYNILDTQYNMAWSRISVLELILCNFYRKLC